MLINTQTRVPVASSDFDASVEQRVTLKQLNQWTMDAGNLLFACDALDGLNRLCKTLAHRGLQSAICLVELGTVGFHFTVRVGEFPPHCSGWCVGKDEDTAK